MLSQLHHWSRHLLARLPAAIPSSCALCGIADREAICSGCHHQFFGKSVHRCIQCATPLDGMTAKICGECLKQVPAFDVTIVAADYTPPIDQLVLALKFGSRLALAPLFARMLRDAILQARTQDAILPTCITAVPLGAQRLAERGFNQALEIAKPLSRSLGIKLMPQLTSRLRDTSAQAMLHPDERHKNMRNAFVVSHHAIDSIKGQHIGVVDDVMTTGETLNELAATLKRFGAARVTNFVFARTLPKH
ncbi:MAG TPA: phosphoribosyltransferase family protein [Burkholderiaceae bacterium]|jgi:ComF family protein